MAEQAAIHNNARRGIHSNTITEEAGAIQEEEEDFEDDSSEIDDEDEFNANLQKNSINNSLENVPQSEIISRAQTEPHGDIAEYQYQYKNNETKHVEKIKNHKNKDKDKDYNNNHKSQKTTKLLNKSKSDHHLNKKNDKYKHKKSYKRDDIDEEEVDVESIEDDDFDPTYNITEDDQYMNMSVTSQEINDNHYKKETKPKRSSTLDMVKNGFMNAKKRLLSPEKVSTSYNNNRGSGDNNVSDNNYSPTPDSTNRPNSSSKSDSDNKNRKDSGSINRKDSDSIGQHIKKSSVSFLTGGGNLLSKGKGLFQRSNSNKEAIKQYQQSQKGRDSPQYNNGNYSPNSNGNDSYQHKHRKSGSKTNLKNIKAKFYNIKKSYSSKNLVSRTPTPEQEQNMENRKRAEKRKRDKKKKKSSKKYDKEKENDRNYKDKDKDKDKEKDKEIRKKERRKSKQKPIKPSKSTKDKTKDKNKNLSDNNGKIRKRSSSQNQENIKSQRGKGNKTNGNGTDKNIKSPPKRQMTIKPKEDVMPKRHSMQPVMRSRSQNRIGKNNNNTSSNYDKYSNKPKKKDKSSKHHNNKLDPNKKHRKTEDPKLLLRKSASTINPNTIKQLQKEDDYKSGDDNNTNGTKLKPEKKHRSASREVHKKGRNGTKDKTSQLDLDIIAADKKCKFRIKNEIFELYEYYKPIRLIGSGAYAVVCEAIDERTKKRVAIKKNKHIFDDIRDARRILRECKLLLHFTKFKHPDLIEIYDSLPPTTSEIQDFEDVYIVMPLLESNLCKIITSKQKLSNLHYQYLTYQVLRGLKFIHESGVIHRDIKPENILLNGSDCDVKIIDFGLARGVIDLNDENEDNAKATEYVCTRWYRSPEVMCSGGRYDEKMDIWGVGCILAEMILRRPLFPGANYLDQLQQIFDIMGTPQHTEWILNDQARSWVQKLPKHNGKNFKKMLAHKFEDNVEDLENCVDLLYKLLALNPYDRISAADSLKHPYFKDMHDEDEILNGDKFDLSFEFEQSIKTKFGVRHMMYSALNDFHKKQWAKIRKKQKKRAQREKDKKYKNKKNKSSHSHHHSSKHHSSSNHHKKHKKHRSKHHDHKNE